MPVSRLTTLYRRSDASGMPADTRFRAHRIVEAAKANPEPIHVFFINGRLKMVKNASDAELYFEKHPDTLVGVYDKTAVKEYVCDDLEVVLGE